MEFATALRFVQKEVNKNLIKYFNEKKKEAMQLDRHAATLVDAVSEFTLRPGKRIRPFLVWLGSGENLKAMPAMMAVELFQTFALIHDDIIDNDSIRRGGPTVHTTIGVNLAILAGDLALAWADECMAQTKNTKAVALYQKMKEETTLGQSLDVLRKENFFLIKIQRINELKTAYYTVIRPLQIGAILGGEHDLSWYETYGLSVGLLFQLRDDFLDKEISKERFERELKKIHIPEARPIYREFARFVLTRDT